MSPPAAPRATRLTGRAAVLAVVICAIALSLAYPVREYVNQRRQIDALVAPAAVHAGPGEGPASPAGQALQPGLHRAASPAGAQHVLPRHALLHRRGEPVPDQHRPRRTSRARHPGTTSCGDRSSRRTRTRRARRSDRGTGRGGHRRPARPYAAWAARRGAPVPVRAARCRRDGAAAARRQPVFHPVLPDLPAGRCGRQQAGGGRADAGDEREAGRRRAAAPL